MKKVTQLLPFTTERLLIRMIKYEDINWYINTLKQPFFNEFVDVDPSKSADTIIMSKLIGLISAHKMGIGGKTEVRAVIEMGGKPVGGITIFPCDSKDTYEIGYWIIPEYQRKGIGLEALKGLTNKLEFNIKGLKQLRLIIRVDNHISKLMAEKAGYKYKKSFQGKNKENSVYEYNPIKFG